MFGTMNHQYLDNPLDISWVDNLSNGTVQFKFNAEDGGINVQQLAIAANAELVAFRAESTGVRASAFLTRSPDSWTDW